MNGAEGHERPFSQSGMACGERIRILSAMNDNVMLTNQFYEEAGAIEGAG
jgi:hypothetical protein